ncbi:hypothetical protein D9M73_248070 [compost metagenome]
MPRRDLDRLVEVLHLEDVEPADHLRRLDVRTAAGEHLAAAHLHHRRVGLRCEHLADDALAAGIERIDPQVDVGIVGLRVGLERRDDEHHVLHGLILPVAGWRMPASLRSSHGRHGSRQFREMYFRRISSSGWTQMRLAVDASEEPAP